MLLIITSVKQSKTVVVWHGTTIILDIFIDLVCIQQQVLVFVKKSSACTCAMLKCVWKATMRKHVDEKQKIRYILLSKRKSPKKPVRMCLFHMICNCVGIGPQYCAI